MIELRHNTEQIVRVGVLLSSSKDYPIAPILGAELDWFWWRYLVKADGTVVDILNHVWSDIPNCDGLYFLTLTAPDTDKLGQLILYIHDESTLGKPIFMEFEVVSQCFWDAKYNNDCLVIESQAQKG